MPSQNERVKASKLRKKRQGGKPLSPEQAAFLVDYEKRVTKSTIKRAKASAPAPRETSVRGPQLQIAGTANANGGHIHATTPPTGNVDPMASLWTPTVPPATEGSEPPPPGSPPPPTEGSPVMGAAATIDPKAGEQLSFIVRMIAGVGFKNAMEMIAEYEMPEEMKPYIAELAKPTNVLEGMRLIDEACKRLAVKYQLKGVPLSDELLVGVVVAGSTMTVVAKFKRKKLKASKKPQVAAAPAPAPGPTEPDAQQVPDELAGVWGKS